MRTTVILLALTIGLSSACIRKQEKPAAQPPPPQPAPATKSAPLAENDLAGRKRAKPRPTMGALEAETTTPRQAPRPPKKSAADARTEKRE